ncbi:V-type proton ATPase subunit D-like [Leguminivora glycinivorella]|uniref:V-type proton ATPase subunit D-like n=1 Tax=Leguminivora glycinivorella TaxID=1035111 RepID=UPI00200FC611|nr:V-type proton ATPase subunit D-like [Leguminivora glycinivorella]
MNTTDRYPATASQFMLREIKRQQELVNRGYQLLKRKAEALRIKGRQTASDLSVTQALLGHTLREAYISLAAVKFTNGESNALVLENIEEAQIRVKRIPENISGVSTVTLHAIEEFGASDALRYAGLGAGGHRTGEAKRAFREAVHILIKFASLRNTCILLDNAIRSTLRKVNGIEKVIMPKLSNTMKYIQVELAEREREEMHRLKMVKAKKIRAKALAKMRLEDSQNGYNAAGGEGAEIDVRSASRIRSIECLTSIVCACKSLPSTDSIEDFSKPICQPAGWDDEDLLF